MLRRAAAMDGQAADGSEGGLRRSPSCRSTRRSRPSRPANEFALVEDERGDEEA